ncbi:MAG TPA: hypothetical protein VE422_23870 [Terriglobia bacterium]|nr:hypothetical protein [Terriglobia bacterium]
MTKYRRAFLTAAIFIGVGLAADLWGPRKASLRQFDPGDVAGMETDMWQSYYSGQRLRLFNQLASLLRRQYRLPPLRSYVVAFHGAKAAFVFKDGANRTDYERALPDLLDYYHAIRRISDTPFNADRAARLELEWWVVHRERDKRPRTDLAEAVAALAAEIYGSPAAQFQDHGRYRAEAMLARDQLAGRNDVTEADWQKIHELLDLSWQSLWKAVNPAVPSP